MDTRKQFLSENFLVVKAALEPSFCRTCEKYVRMLDEFHPDLLYQDQETGSVGRYVDPLAESVLDEVTQLVQANTGLSVVPTYSYLRLYKNGAELTRHTDRPSCEISATLFLGASEAEDWPIFVEVDGQQKAVHLEAGDLMIYRGIDVPHWRERFSGDYSAHMFLHYVDKAGPHADLIYDGRSALGAPPAAAAPVRAHSTGVEAGPAPSTTQTSSNAQQQRMTIDQLVEDPSYFLAGFEWRTNTAVFHQIDRSIPPNHCELAAERPRLNISIQNLVDMKLDQRLDPSRPMHFIWMTDFCMSTLFAKSLGYLSDFYLYNENQLFSSLAYLKRAIDEKRTNCPVELWDKLLKIALVLQGRTFERDEISISKEWISSAYIMPEIMRASETYKTVFLYGPLREYLAKALKKDARIGLAKMRVQKELTDIASIAPFDKLDLVGLNDVQALVVHWLYAVSKFNQLHDIVQSDRVASLMSTQFVEDPLAALRASTLFYGANTTEKDLRNIIDADDFGRHAKHGHRFSLAQHSAELEELEVRYSAQIEEGFAYAETLLGMPIDSLVVPGALL